MRNTIIAYSIAEAFKRRKFTKLAQFQYVDQLMGSNSFLTCLFRFCTGVQNEAGQRITEFCQGNTWVIANTLFQQHKRWLYTWTSPDSQYWNQIDYTLWMENEIATHSSTLAWRIPWTEEPGGADVYGVAKSWARLSN